MMVARASAMPIDHGNCCGPGLSGEPEKTTGNFLDRHENVQMNRIADLHPLIL